MAKCNQLTPLPCEGLGLVEGESGADEDVEQTHRRCE